MKPAGPAKIVRASWGAETLVKLKICAIDDVISMRKALCRVLTADGANRVFDFASAPEAIRFLGHNHVDVVVSDIFLEKGSGLEVLRYVRTRPLLSDIPVIFVTGEVTRDDIVAAIDGGVSDYILKPFEVADLVDKVTAAFSKYQNPSQRVQLVRSAEAALLEGDTARAWADFGAVQKLLPKSEGTGGSSPRAAVGLARVDIAECDVSSAMRRLRQVMADHPLYFSTYVLMVDSLLGQERYGEASEILEKELEINGKQPNRRLLAAALLDEAGEPERALQHLRQSLVDNPKDVRLLLRMAQTYRGTGDRDKALHYYLKTRRVARRSQEALSGIVEVCGDNNEWKRAKQFLTDQLNANRNAWEVYIFRARVNESMGLLDGVVG